MDSLKNEKFICPICFEYADETNENRLLRWTQTTSKILSRSQDQSNRLQPAVYKPGKFRIAITLPKLPAIHQ